MPESQNTEWKSKWKDEYLEWICGYANAQGGKIYIGCDDDGNVLGLPNARKLLEDIPNKIRDAMGLLTKCHIIMGWQNKWKEKRRPMASICVPYQSFEVQGRGGKEAVVLRSLSSPP